MKSKPQRSSIDIFDLWALQGDALHHAISPDKFKNQMFEYAQIWIFLKFFIPSHHRHKEHTT